jgi:transcriptional regulator with XRE-family HTH domain
MFSDLLRRDREAAGLSIGQAAGRLRLTAAEYRRLEAGVRTPNFETWDRICKLYGWPQTLVGPRS